MVKIFSGNSYKSAFFPKNFSIDKNFSVQLIFSDFIFHLPPQKVLHCRFSHGTLTVIKQC